MNVTYRRDKDVLYIAVEGRVDASNAPTVEEKIFSIKSENAGARVVIDADALEYISSAGLRIILKLRKDDHELEIINVSPDVYEVLDMTGFTDMVKVRKAYRRLSVDGCEFIARGANGAVYRYDAETIVKSFFARDALPAIQQEHDNARKAFVLGINTAIPYDIVRIGDGYGTVMELLNATSITNMICDNPDDLQTSARYYIDMLKNIHATEIGEGEVPSMRKTSLEWADFVAPHLPEEQGRKLKSLFESLPDRNNLIHGDYNTNNVMVQNGEALLIDMDTLCMGHPIFELGSMYNAFLGFSSVRHANVEKFMGYNRTVSEKFWRLSLSLYLGTDDEEVCRSVAEKAMIVGHVRLLRRALRRPDEDESPEMIAFCKKLLGELLQKVDTLDF